jgi:transformation/transcription domain-associated protein
LPQALHSPKVLTECPIAVVLIFQTYKQVMQPAMLDFYPLVMESIKIQPEPQRLAHAEAKERGEIFTGVAPAITNRDVYAELIKAQVKVGHRLNIVYTSVADGRPWPSWRMF